MVSQVAGFKPTTSECVSSALTSNPWFREIIFFPFIWQEVPPPSVHQWLFINWNFASNLNLLKADRVDNDDDPVRPEGHEAVRAPVDGPAVGGVAEAGDGSQDDLEMKTSFGSAVSQNWGAAKKKYCFFDLNMNFWKQTTFDS